MLETLGVLGLGQCRRACRAQSVGDALRLSDQQPQRLRRLVNGQPVRYSVGHLDIVAPRAQCDQPCRFRRVVGVVGLSQDGLKTHQSVGGLGDDFHLQQAQLVGGVAAQRDSNRSDFGLLQQQAQQVAHFRALDKAPEALSDDLRGLAVWPVILAGEPVEVSSHFDNAIVFVQQIPDAHTRELSFFGKRPPVGLRLLLVDDHDALRRFLSRILIAEGLEVIEAEGGDQAWKLLESGTVVDAILTDIVMPEGSGVALARRVRDSGRGLPVIFMTGFAADEVEETTREFPELQVLRKPFRASDVLQALSGIPEIS